MDPMAVCCYLASIDIHLRDNGSSGGDFAWLCVDVRWCYCEPYRCRRHCWCTHCTIWIPSCHERSFLKRKSLRSSSHFLESSWKNPLHHWRYPIGGVCNQCCLSRIPPTDEIAHRINFRHPSRVRIIHMVQSKRIQNRSALELGLIILMKK